MSVEEMIVADCKWIRRRAGRYYRNKADADDLASETIYKCLSASRRFEKGCSFRPWVSVVMQNTFITQYNRRRKILFTGYDDLIHEFADELMPDRQSVAKDMLSILRHFASQSVGVVDVILYAKGYTYEEIAEMEGIPIGTVRSRISFGRKLLRTAFEL